jgi:hypothetical protein
MRVHLKRYAQMRQPLGGGTTSCISLIRLEHWTIVTSASCSTKLDFVWQQCYASAMFMAGHVVSSLVYYNQHSVREHRD